MARLDRLADRLGIVLTVNGSRRTFDMGHGRQITYKPQGAGSFLIEANLHGQLEAVTVCGEERIERIFSRMKRERRNEPFPVQ